MVDVPHPPSKWPTRPMSWYLIGPELGVGQQPWVYLWERDARVDDGHVHVWESVLLPAYPGSLLAEVVRCVECFCPCCANIRDEIPCTQRRGHVGDHKAPSGQTWAIGVSPPPQRS